VCGGHTELASLLIERRANTEEVNDHGYTPLMEAVRQGHEDVVTLLIHRGMLLYMLSSSLDRGRQMTVAFSKIEMFTPFFQNFRL